MNWFAVPNELKKKVINIYSTFIPQLDEPRTKYY